MRATSVLSLLSVAASAAVSISTAGCAPTITPRPAATPILAPAAPPAPAPASTVAPGKAQVIVNGGTGPTGPVSCSTDDGLTTITIGESSLGVSVVVTDDEEPAVHSVSIGDVGGVALAFALEAGSKTPAARRNGATVIVSGTGSGTDSADPARLVDSSYQIAVACP